jgi:hypothetical protein
MSRILAPILLLLLAALACTISPRGESSPTATATPPPNQLVTFRLPIFTSTISPGETIRGTGMTYIGREGEFYNVSIGGLPAAKRIGDSLTWKGVMAPGVVGNFNLRISPTLLSDDLLAAGSAEIIVLNPIPVELGNDYTVLDSLLNYSNLAVDYTVATGDQVPGTTLIYEGLVEQGVQLGGTSGFPIRAVGDSLIWTGRLRGNVVVRHSLRVASADENSLHLVGTGELWITPSR